MAYIKSNLIQAYPVVNRNMEVSGDLYARHTSEESLTSIVNKLIDTDGFVITPQTEFGIAGEKFKFNIHGYYFTVSPDSELSESTAVGEILKAVANYGIEVKVGDVIYAAIKLTRRGSSTTGWVELDGQDETGKSGNYVKDIYGEIIEEQSDIPNEDDYHYSSVYFYNAPLSEDDGWISIPLFKYVGEDSPFAWREGCYVKNEYYLKFKDKSFSVDGGDLDS